MIDQLMEEGLFSNGPFFLGQSRARAVLGVVGIFWQAGGELFDLLLHIFYLFEDEGHGVARFFGFGQLFVVWNIVPGDAGTAHLDLCFRKVCFQQAVNRNVKIIANNQQLIQAGFADPILPVTDGRLTFLDQRCNLRLGSGGLFPEMPEIFS
jgi:hypothetical protein